LNGLKTDNAPPWTELGNNQCLNCPLDTAKVSHCPAALAFHHVADQFGFDLSIIRVDVTVEAKARSYFKNVDLQTCLRSLFGLIMASSGCPVLGRLRPLAYFHLPFATLQETVLRIVGAYLVKQYLVGQSGDGKPDWDLKGIEALYRDLETVNLHMMKRVRTASREDANINAVQTLVSMTCLVNMSLPKLLEEIKPVLNEGL